MARNKRKKYRGFWIFIRIQLVLFLGIVGFLCYYLFGGYASEVSQLRKEAKKIARTSTVEDFRPTETGYVYDASGNVISRLRPDQDSNYITISEIPLNARYAITSIEDKKFYKHKGYDIKGIARAAVAMFQDREVTQGGSTITQQLAKNIYLTPERTWERKIKELFLAIELEERYSKDQILEFYLNNIYFANGFYGIEAAAEGYFAKPLSALSLSQTAFLCAIPNSPTKYDPMVNFESTIDRRNIILGEMLEDGRISKSTYDAAITEQINIERTYYDKINYVETYIYHCVDEALESQGGIQFNNGYQVYTSIDLDMQESLQRAIDSGLEGLYGEKGDPVQGAAVCIDNTTGYVKAIVGGRDESDGLYTLNRAYQSYRQPGSTIKPLIVYTPCLERGYTPDTIVLDEELEDGPANVDEYYAGEITFRQAVTSSKNTVAWKLFDEISPRVGLGYLLDMDFQRIDKEDYRLPAALGGLTYGVSPLEMAAAYATLQNDGQYRAPTCIVRITDASGNEIYNSNQIEKQVYTRQASRQMTDMMMSVMTAGTGRQAQLEDMQAAGKTGTTNDNKDGWFVGYTRYFTTSVWVGCDMPQTVEELKGSTYPSYIWQSYMEEIHKGLGQLGLLLSPEYEYESKRREEFQELPDYWEHPSWIYDEYGNLIEMRDDKGNPLGTQYDENGQPILPQEIVPQEQEISPEQIIQEIPAEE